MKLVDRIHWENCLKCKHSLYEDCVEYAYQASLHDVIGCEYLSVDDDNGGLVPPVHH